MHAWLGKFLLARDLDEKIDRQRTRDGNTESVRCVENYVAAVNASKIWAKEAKHDKCLQIFSCPYTRQYCLILSRLPAHYRAGPELKNSSLNSRQSRDMGVSNFQSLTQTYRSLLFLLARCDHMRVELGPLRRVSHALDRPTDGRCRPWAVGRHRAPSSRRRVRGDIRLIRKVRCSNRVQDHQISRQADPVEGEMQGRSAGNDRAPEDGRHTRGCIFVGGRSRRSRLAFRRRR